MECNVMRRKLKKLSASGFASAYYYEKLSANTSAFVCVILALLCALIASALGGLIDDIESLKCLHTGQRLSIGASRRKAHGKVGRALAGIALDNCQLSKWDIGKP